LISSTKRVSFMTVALVALAAALLTCACGTPPPTFQGQGGIIDSPVGVTINGRYAYIMNANFDLSGKGKGAITVIDIPTSLVNRFDCLVRRIEAPAYLGQMVLSPDRQTGYLANRAGDSILLVDLSDPSWPKIMDLNPDHRGNQGINVGSEPFGLTVSPDGRTLYVANVGSGDLSIVDLVQKKLVKNELLEWGINEVRIQPRSRYAYVTNKGMAAVALIDVRTNRFVTAFALGSQRTGLGIDTRGIDFTPDGKLAFIAARQPNSLLVVDTTKIPSHIDRAVMDILPMDLKPTAVRVMPDGREVWVTNFDSNNVFAIDVRTLSVLEVITVGGGPYDLAITDEDPENPGQYYVFVPNFTSHNVSLIDARTKEYIWAIP